MKRSKSRLLALTLANIIAVAFLSPTAVLSQNSAKNVQTQDLESKVVAVSATSVIPMSLIRPSFLCSSRSTKATPPIWIISFARIIHPPQFRKFGFFFFAIFLKLIGPVWVAKYRACDGHHISFIVLQDALCGFRGLDSACSYDGWKKSGGI